MSSNATPGPFYVPLSKFIAADFEKRKEKNTSYSLRSYSKFLEVPHSTLYALMLGRNAGSKALLDQIALKLELKEEEYLYFSTLLRLGRTKDRRKKEDILKQVKIFDTRFNVLTEDEFALVGRWETFAVMELLKTVGAKPDPNWISKRLRIPVSDSLHALGVLQKLKVIEISGTNIRVLKDYLTLPSGRPLQSARDAHRELIQRAERALDEQKKGTQNFSSMVLRFRKSDIAKADEFIKKFRRAFSAEFESGGEHDSVYSVNVQLIRLDHDDG